MSDLQKGIVDRVSGGLAYVKLRGEAEPLPKGMKYPKGQTPVAGGMVMVSQVSGVYIILAVY